MLLLNGKEVDHQDHLHLMACVCGLTALFLKGASQKEIDDKLAVYSMLSTDKRELAKKAAALAHQTIVAGEEEKEPTDYLILASMAVE